LQQAHKDLLAVATAKLGELKSGAASVDDGLLDYLRSWLKNHIKVTDIPSYGR
jgi:hemerythrin